MTYSIFYVFFVDADTYDQLISLLDLSKSWGPCFAVRFLLVTYGMFWVLLVTYM